MSDLHDQSFVVSDQYDQNYAESPQTERLDYKYIYAAYEYNPAQLSGRTNGFSLA